MKFSKILISIISLVVVILIILLVNHFTLSCDAGDNYNENSELCYYEAVNGITDCKQRMAYGDGNCYYRQAGLISGTVLIIIVIITGVISFIFILITIMNRKKQVKFIGEMIQKEELDWYNQVRPAFEEIWGKEYKLFMNEGKVPEGTFNYNERESYTDKKSGRRFIQFEFECYTCENVRGNGIFTAIAPLDKEKDEDLKTIVGNNLRPKHCRFDQYKISANRPLGLPKSKEELLRNILQTAESPEDVLQRVQMQKNILGAFDPVIEAQQEMAKPEPVSNISQEDLEDMEPFDRMLAERKLQQGRTKRQGGFRK